MSQNAEKFAAQKANCVWISEKAKELESLLSYDSTQMLAANKTRALSAAKTMLDALEELIRFIQAEAPDDAV